MTVTFDFPSDVDEMRKMRRLRVQFLILQELNPLSTLRCSLASAGIDTNMAAVATSSHAT